MSQKNYHDKNCDLDVLFTECEAWFIQRNYQTQSHKSEGAWLIQATQAEAWRVAAGASRAFNIRIEGEPNNFSVELSTGAWATNLAAGGVAALLTGGATLLISAATTGWSKKIEGDLSLFIEQRIDFGVKARSSHDQGVMKSHAQLEEKLRQLKAALENGFITEAAYNAKKLTIESETHSSIEAMTLQEQLDKLQAAFNAGVLSQDEFDAKRREFTQHDGSPDQGSSTARLSQLLAAGLLTQQEYDDKKATLDHQLAIAAKVKQLQDARDAGILTNQEFETKKQALLA